MAGGSRLAAAKSRDQGGHIACSREGVRIAMLGLLLVTAAACSPAQRQVVGGGIAVVGLGVTVLALESMASSCQKPGELHDDCANKVPSSPAVALPVALGGLGVAVLGVVVMSTEGENSQPSPTRAPAAPAPPAEPTAFDQTDAVGMAVAQLVLSGLRRKPKPTELLDVDETQCSLHVEGRFAELQNLRVRTASDATWRTVGACYEFDSDWHLTSLGATPECPR